jgi:molecular chaperone Hsp33
MGASEGYRASDEERLARDGALPFQLDALGVRGRLVRLGSSLDAIIERHGYPLAVARPLAEAMVLCAALATSLKYDGIFTLQISGDGPIRVLVTDLTTDGALRGYAQFDSWKLAVALGAGHNGEVPEGYVPKLFGRGRLAFTVDQGQHTQRYQGVVPLEGATLADCAHTYFRQSEQLPTGIKIAARRTTEGGTPGASGHWRASALMVQQMPEFDAGRIDVDREQREDDWRKAVILMASATEAEMLDARLPAMTLLHRLFHAEQPRLFARRPFMARCRCSRERIDRVLRSIKREELDDLRDKSGRVAVKCEFCSTEYTYDDSDLDRIYASAA